MKILISAWIPRSYTHLREAYAGLGFINLDIENILFEEDLSFTIKSFLKKADLKFTLTPVGIYSFSFDLPKGVKRKEFIHTIRELLLETLIKRWHTVTYKQIKAGTIPFYTSTFIFDSSKTKIELSNEEVLFSEKFIEKKLPIYQALQFNDILLDTVDDYIVKMSEYYHRADVVVRSLKGDFELSELKRTVFEMDYIEKTTGEIVSRIKDSKDSLIREMELIDELVVTKVDESKYKLHNLLERAIVDLDYTERLWGQMDIMLDNLDNASNARLSYQETVESRRVEWFLSVEAASVIATLIASAFISEFTGLNAVILSITFLLVWGGIFYIMKKIRAK
ncbi:hypothetical protein C0584_03365 [Candidatus Parcubacteria bacterium]|nr:MAG: hypothetical protein C0584_03365 [Candidatus Parcubacteria bacterium]